MLAYYVRLAAISIRKNAVMSALMVCAVALGIGACMTFANITYLLTKDPIPAKSDVLYAVQLDSWGPDSPFRPDGTPPTQLTYLDATALMRAQHAAEPPAFRQAAMSRTGFVVEPEDADARPFDASGRATYGGFFAMFDVPFLFGQGWDAAADTGREQVAVLSRAINERLFGGENSVGRNLHLSGRTYRIVGVLDSWKPMPKFYDLGGDATGDPADIFIPFSLIAALELPRIGNINCWKPLDGDGLQAFLASECIWIQFWAELPNEAEKRRYLAFLDNYADEQKRLGRFQRPLNNRVRDVNQRLDDGMQGTGPAAMLLAVGVMFLAVCLLNTVGLLLAKFLGRAPEIGLRRALGASRRTVFCQYLVESGCIGVAGGAGGVAMTWLGLRGIEALFGDIIASLLVFDGAMVALAVVLAVLCTLVAGLYPTWRACNVQPAAQLKA